MNNMEQDCVAGVYQVLDMSAGQEVSSKEVVRLLGKQEQNGNLRKITRLKTAGRQCWTRLTLEGVQSILSSPWLGHNLKLRGQAWGCVSIADVLLLVDMKYDVVNRLLFVEMLQEHYTQSLWETMQPWQQHKEKEELEDHAVEALEAGDMLHLATLPGAFRMYRVNLGAEFREESWSAVSLLCDIYIYREQERDELTGLGEWLDRESLKVLCLYVMVAMLKVCREKVSYSALLAARQSWKAWPQVSSPGREEQASLWLCGEDEHSENLMSASPQQAELQLLALTQDLEKRQLVKLLHDISLDNLEENQQLTALRNVCTERLRQIQSGQQRGTEYGTLAENANAEAKLHSRPQIPTGVCREGVLRPQYALRECAMLLLTQLQQIHDVKAFALLQQLTHKNKKHFQNTQSENESKLLMEVKTDLLQVLSTGHHLTSDLMSSGNGTDQIRGSGSGPAFSLSVASDQKTDGGINVRASADETAKLQVRKDCGSDMEEMPYLEILCVPDSTSERHRSSTIEEHGTRKESEDNSAGLQTYEKQGSLITFAWSKQPYEDEANETEETVVVIEQSRDRESGVETLQQKDKSEEVCDERFNVGPERCVPTGPLEADEQVLKERAMEPISAMVREKTIQNLVDIQRKVEQKQQREKERQLLRVQERLSIIQSRKTEEDLLGLKVTDLLRQLTQDLPQEDKTQQKTVVRERVDQLRRECSYVLQSKRERNTAGFKELLRPVESSQEQEDKGD